ncbi:thiaminase II [Halococcus hamelinensis]|uniref:Transcriptional activator, TenA family protein n=1 Tax=Halococcus hamelinensis 100A6 TaxID=1132509 RepID=M0LQG9_9EURY|nr:thiaminase II [Halococcus hamelinensis]EMA35726.1 transcriptional activator, TenA family protein [Halococcus hamelinensis 100A6]
MAFSDDLLDSHAALWDAQRAHPFVVELAEGSLDEAAFRHWVEQDYRYLLDYARTFAVAGVRARDEATMTRLLGIAHTTLATELDLHRAFAADYGLTAADLETVEKTPTCVAYTNYLLRVAHQGSFAEISAAVYPCGQGYLDIADHMATLATDDHRYTPFIEKYTGDEFRETVAWLRSFVDRCAEEYPGERDAMRATFERSARLEAAFWEMAYTEEAWPV